MRVLVVPDAGRAVARLHAFVGRGSLCRGNLDLLGARALTSALGNASYAPTLPCGSPGWVSDVSDGSGPKAGWHGGASKTATASPWGDHRAAGWAQAMVTDVVAWPSKDANSHGWHDAVMDDHPRARRWIAQHPAHIDLGICATALRLPLPGVVPDEEIGLHRWIADHTLFPPGAARAGAALGASLFRSPTLLQDEPGHDLGRGERFS